MQRREFIRNSLSLSFGAITASTFSTPALATLTCTQPAIFNGALVRRCSVDAGGRLVRAQQACDQWCWAACIQTAFHMAGYEVNQRLIVEKLFGPSVPCVPILGPQIAQAVEGQWHDQSGRPFSATTRTHMDLSFGVHDPFALQRASGYLANDVPLIVGALGHATLLTEMVWLEDNLGNTQLQELVVLDPWPGNVGRRLLSPTEFFGTTYLSAVLVS